VNWWDLDSLGQLWFAAENKIGGKYDDWECTKESKNRDIERALLIFLVLGR
jgi:hypothetical protein